MKIKDDYKLVEIDKPNATKAVSIQLGGVTVDLDRLAHEVEGIFIQYGVCRALRAHHNEHLPLFETRFTSEHTLDLFLKKQHIADRKLEEAISHLNPGGPYQIHTHLYFIVPQNGKQKTHLEMVTPGNCEQIVAKYRESFSFVFQPDLFKECTGWYGFSVL